LKLSIVRDDLYWKWVWISGVPLLSLCCKIVVLLGSACGIAGGRVELCTIQATHFGSVVTMEGSMREVGV
jgi:hypothetical protein